MSKYQNNEVTPVAPHSRTAELVLGIIGGIFGIIAGLLAMTIGGIGSALETSGSAGGQQSWRWLHYCLCPRDYFKCHD
ncbi:hypothetical protein [Lactiplantibacillus plantarum]|uniref:hypothetical protein n=1 Tax=Lactiplantibacillus plantarum TaxID=1590 RepID=UPI00223FFC93|nr:hypothetical protein [Lactiplantibacillus plantarum]